MKTIIQEVMGEQCPWCGATFELTGGPLHEYIESSPGCWDAYIKVLAREYENYTELSDIHWLTVDTYSVQHPGKPGRKSIQSVCGHLVSLCFVLEKNYSGDLAGKMLQRFVEKKTRLSWLDPPDFEGTLNVSNVLAARNNEEHVKTVRQWAESVFGRWMSKHREAIEEMARGVC
jgi:hypothetical protein